MVEVHSLIKLNRIAINQMKSLLGSVSMKKIKEVGIDG